MSCQAHLVPCALAMALTFAAPPAFSDEVEAVSPTSPEREAETDTDEDELGEERELNGHLFVPFTLTLWSFVDTSVASTTSAGMGSLTLPEEDVRFVDNEASVAAAVQTFILRVAATRWLGFEARVGGGLLAGNDRTGAVFVGANLTTAADGRVMFRFLRTPWLQLSGSIDGGGARADTILPRRLLDSVTIVDGVLSYDPTIKSTGWRAYGGGSLTAAIGVTSWLGVQMSAEGKVRRVDPDDRVDGDEETEGAADAGLGLTFDTGPVVLLAGAGVTHDFRDDEEGEITAASAVAKTRGLAEVGMHLQVPEALDIGLTLLGSYAEDDQRLFASFRIGYFW